MPDDSVDSLVTDPPAGIAFMGKSWDTDKGGSKEWMRWMESVMRECLRVLKPGGHGLVWALPRTSHWTAMSLEWAGFEIRDCVYHVFGQGFPKSLDIAKAIDTKAGLRGSVLGTKVVNDFSDPRIVAQGSMMQSPGQVARIEVPILSAASAASAAWEGWGTALKPAVECWWLVQKPMTEKTVIENLLKWGTGAMNIDSGRIPTSDDCSRKAALVKNTSAPFGAGEMMGGRGSDLGRWPANCVLGEEAVESLGSAAQYFYCAKISTSERNAGLDNFEKKIINSASPPGSKGAQSPRAGAGRGEAQANTHPTVKPRKLMSYLIRLVTPPKGRVLDCFMGSGSTGCAAVSEGFDFIGIEREPDYFAIAKARIKHAQKESAE